MDLRTKWKELNCKHKQSWSKSEEIHGNNGTGTQHLDNPNDLDGGYFQELLQLVTKIFATISNGNNERNRRLKVCNLWLEKRRNRKTFNVNILIINMSRGWMSLTNRHEEERSFIFISLHTFYICMYPWRDERMYFTSDIYMFRS